MPPLTLQEVIDRINQTYVLIQERATADSRLPDGSTDQPHHPEFYVPRITRRIASLMLGAFLFSRHIS